MRSVRGVGWRGSAVGVALGLFAIGAETAGAETVTVTNRSDRTDGDTSSVAALLAAPGPDGIALREALEATNGDPGEHTIRFSSAVRGKTIVLEFDLPPLLGGGVTIEGAGVRLRTKVKLSGSPCGRCALHVASSRNTIRGLTLVGFGTGVLIGPYRPVGGGPPPIGTVLAGNVVRGLDIRRAGTFGIALRSVWSPRCGVPKPKPCRTRSVWRNTTVMGNTIDVRSTGIAAKLANSGDRIVGATVTGNEVHVRGSKDTGIAFQVGGDSVNAKISGVEIAGNRITGRPGIGIDVAAGTQRGRSGLVRGTRVLDNRLRLDGSPGGFCCQGIVIQAGSDTPEAMFPGVRPVRYPDGNENRDTLVRGNVISGHLVWGVSIQAGIGNGGSRNLVAGVRLEKNTIRSNNPLGPGVFVWIGDGEPFKGRYARRNRLLRISIDSNEIRIGRGGRPSGLGEELAGGVVLVGGGAFGRDGAVRDVRIRRSTISARGGIKLIGGMASNASGNRVSCVRISKTRAPVSVRSNVFGASGNRATRAC